MPLLLAGLAEDFGDDAVSDPVSVGPHLMEHWLDIGDEAGAFGLDEEAGGADDGKTVNLPGDMAAFDFIKENEAGGFLPGECDGRSFADVEESGERGIGRFVQRCDTEP